MIASIRDNDDVRFEHRGAGYLIHRLTPQDWVIRSDDGRTVGSLTVTAQEGEEHEPVYGGIVAGGNDTEYEGSDWESIVRALVNESLEADEHGGTTATTPTPPRP